MEITNTQLNTEQKGPVLANNDSPNSNVPDLVSKKENHRRETQETLAKAPSAVLPEHQNTEPRAKETLSVNNPKSPEEKMRTLKKFNELAEKASVFEFAMALLGTVVTGAQADWISYMHESFGEFAENHLISSQEGHKEINPLMKGLFKGLAFLFGIKGEGGKALEKTSDFIGVQDRLVGALSMFTSSISGLVIAFGALPRALTGKQSLDFSNNIPGLRLVSTKVLPVVNAALMWMTGSAKRHLALDIQKQEYNEENKDDINGSFASGIQDYLCGMNSAALMVRQVIGAVSPKLANVLEPILASWIAGSSFKEGMGAYKEHEEETPKFEMNSSLDKVLGPVSYKLARAAAKPLGVDLPEESQLNLAV